MSKGGFRLRTISTIQHPCAQLCALSRRFCPASQQLASEQKISESSLCKQRAFSTGLCKDLRLVADCPADQAGSRYMN